MYKLSFFIPESHVDLVKESLFKKGAGRIGQYDCCSWQVSGQGQFRPLEGSDPFLGARDVIEKVAEYKVEMVCDDNIVADVLNELLKTHPYQEPAYEVYKMIDPKSIMNQ